MMYDIYRTARTVVTLFVLAVSAVQPCCADFEAVGEYRFMPYTRASIREFRETVSRDRIAAEEQLLKKFDNDRDKVEKHPVTVAISLMETTAADLSRRTDAGEALQRLEPAFDRLNPLSRLMRRDEKTGHPEGLLPTRPR